MVFSERTKAGEEKKRDDEKFKKLERELEKKNQECLAFLKEID